MVQIQLINQVLLWERRLEIEESQCVLHKKTTSQDRGFIMKIVRKVERNLDSKIKFNKKTESSVYHYCCAENLQEPKVS